MTGAEEKNTRGPRDQAASGPGVPKLSFEALRVRAQQLSLREQLERQHLLLKRVTAVCSRLIQAVEQSEVFSAIGEIIGNLIGCEEMMIFEYRSARQTFSSVWSTGVETTTLQQFAVGAGLIGRAAHEGVSQFRDRHTQTRLLPHEANLTACVALKLDREVIGVIVALGLLPQKNGLDWVDYEVLKFLETYGAVAVQLQNLQKNPVTP